PHTLTAIAKDATGTTATDSVTVSVNNALGFLPPVAPSLTYAFSGKGAKSWISTDASHDTQIAYARIEGNSTSVTPFGFAIIGLQRNGILVTEVGIPASIPTRRGRCYIEVNGRVNTGLAIVNPNNQDAVISLSFTDSSGTDSGGTSFTLSANH